MGFGGSTSVASPPTRRGSRRSIRFARLERERTAHLHIGALIATVHCAGTILDRPLGVVPWLFKLTRCAMRPVICSE